jgi:hypothetical protein
MSVGTDAESSLKYHSLSFRSEAKESAVCRERIMARGGEASLQRIFIHHGYKCAVNPLADLVFMHPACKITASFAEFLELME